MELRRSSRANKGIAPKRFGSWDGRELMDNSSASSSGLLWKTRSVPASSVRSGSARARSRLLQAVLQERSRVAAAERAMREEELAVERELSELRLAVEKARIEEEEEEFDGGKSCVSGQEEEFDVRRGSWSVRSLCQPSPLVVDAFPVAVDCSTQVKPVPLPDMEGEVKPVPLPRQRRSPLSRPEVDVDIVPGLEKPQARPSSPRRVQHDESSLERQMAQREREFAIREEAYQRQLWSMETKVQAASRRVDVRDPEPRPRTQSDGSQDASADSARPAAAPTSSLGNLAQALTEAVRSATAGTASNSHMKAFMARSSTRDLPVFNGNVEDWPTFITMYRSSSAECGFSDQENTVRLNRALKGKARDSVQHMLALPSNAPQVIRALERRFGRPDMIVQSLIEKTKQLGSIRDGHLEPLIDLSNSVTNLVSTMDLMKCDGHMHNPQLRQELVNKLPAILRLQWGEFAAKSPDALSLRTFAAWLSERADAVCCITTPRMADHGQEHRTKRDRHQKHSAETTLTTSGSETPCRKVRCHYCTKPEHIVPDCPRFKALEVEKRRDWTKEQDRCFKCFGKGHSGRDCRRKGECGLGGCKGKHHHALLHVPPREQPLQETVHHAVQPSTGDVLLRVLPIKLHGPSGTVTTHALLDEGSTVTLIEKTLAVELGATGPRDPLSLRWTNASSQEDETSERVSIHISSLESDDMYEMRGRTSLLDLPFQRVDVQKLTSKWEHLRNIDAPSVTAKPRILIGQDNCDLICSREVREGPRNSPYASRTKLGWVIHGHAGLLRSRVDDDFTFHVWQAASSDDPLHQLVKESFTLESFGTKPLTAPPQSKKEARAAEILRQTTRRVDGRWETGLLWKSEQVTLPTAESHSSALRRLHGVEKKLAKDRDLAQLYSNKITEYVQKGYCRKLSDDEAAATTPRTWYLPHFAVTNPNKPGKIRLVFDAAAKSGGVSLNDTLLAGPDLLKPLTGVLAKFRQNRVAFGGDIREMFHQVRIRPEDTTAQRFLWRDPDQPEPATYQMEVMIFGAVCSPCSAQEVKNRNAAEFAVERPDAAEAIIEKHYMDDYLDSVDSEGEAITRIRDVIDIHQKGGFQMRNWIASSRRVLASIPQHLRARGDVDLSSCTDLPIERTLGLRWNPNADAFTFALSNKIRADDIEAGPLTKRRLLSTIMSVFDPLGFLTCFSITARIILQDVWRTGIGWDDELPSSLHHRWKEWVSDLHKVTDIRIPRCLRPSLMDDDPVELHVFCDASEKAYAAVAYFRAASPEATATTFISARARVAPLKPVSIPRLELQAAVMASRLAQSIQSEHNIAVSRTVFWSDSRTVLCWIRGDAFKFRPFVAHRVGEITELTDTAAWRWLPTKQNVADMATRGVRIADLTGDNRWFKAPDFLLSDENDWPEETALDKPADDVLELKREFVGNASISTHTSGARCLPECTRFSSFLRLVRSTAWVLRYLHVLKCRRRKIAYDVGEISPDELTEAERLLVQRSQAESFVEEVSLLNQGHAVRPGSRLIQLNPVLDNGVLRAKGRIENASAVNQATRCPVILDPKHPLTRLLIDYHHRLGGHHGQERVLNELRQRYWILRMRSAVRQAWNACQTCKVARAKPRPPQMGPLPMCRLTPYVRAFTFTGLDYFGPMAVTVGRRHEKRYGALFTCLSTRAVHLELAASLTTDSAIMAIRRLTARRGFPQEIFSDNGTNFKGADAELKAALQDLDQTRLRDELANKGIKWTFNPPAAPHMGGSWERLVRSVKTSLRVLLKERAPKEEVLLTLLAEAEAIVNSRPLTYVSTDLDDEESLTPFHFLIGQSSPSAVLSPGQFTDRDLCLRKQWRIAQRLAELFWKRWVREYLPTLTRRTKWCRSVEPVKVDDIVFVVDPALPRGTWPRGVITAIHPGRDGVVRVVEVKTKSGTFRRPVSNIAVLDVRR